jgi:hypothetical protein
MLGLPMTIRGGGDPTLKPWPLSRCEDWARRPGALPPMRMTASWFRSSRIDRIQGCGAISAPDGELPSNCRRVGHTAGKAPPTNRACHRARDRQGQVASRWPAATLDRRCARRPIKVRSGRGDDRQLGRTRRWGDRKIKLDINCPIQGFRMPAPMMTAPRTPGAGVRKPSQERTRYARHEFFAF